VKIVPLTLKPANDFVEKWHRHSARTSNDGGKFAIGLEHDGELVGVAIVGRPINRLLQVPGAAELLRLCTSPQAPKGSGSKLYSRAKRIWQLMGGTKFESYTLKREGGATLRGAGIHEGQRTDVPGGRQWDTPSRRRERKEVYEEPKFRWTEDLPEIPA
jgi:hypothetical protein